MKKYRIGIIALILLTIGLTIFTIMQGAGQKQDKQTEKKVSEIATALNNYISKNQEIPDSLEATGIKDVPSTIKFTKESETTYKFCATYKSETDYGSGGISGLLYGAALQNYDDMTYDDYGYGGGLDETYKASTLYPAYSHDKGENCQTVEPRLSGSSYYRAPTSSNTPSISKTARDTERQTDIKALHGQLEAYYAQNGYYPSLTEMNSATFLSSTLKGLDLEALKDPLGTSSKLLAAPGNSYAYSYSVTASDDSSCESKATECADYTLSAKLEAGGAYTKQSLN